ncbi:MAG: hypothetical protein N838_28495 [Thiohalocapsa sp. PB-PSB1]|jgi:hypothetical protein|nr:MAG: hypothetical protein N838_27040 [Thiohalocapsa sp. PB-PSB1]QQO56718.1 MAG: hypothetical protein N838_28495 [Thiohalocapsa sp. PB-PSB1]HCS92378.1 hypothetical protein [Chromatiaceae bacterium]
MSISPHPDFLDELSAERFHIGLLLAGLPEQQRQNGADRVAERLLMLDCPLFSSTAGTTAGTGQIQQEEAGPALGARLVCGS